MLTWDEAKRQANLRKHALDFAGAEAIFDGPVMCVIDARKAYGEQRFNAVGWLFGSVVHFTYTDDGVLLRAISLRKAEKHEIRRYVQYLSS